MSRRVSRSSKSPVLTAGVFDFLLDDHDNLLAGDDDDPFAPFELQAADFRRLWLAHQPALLAEAKRRKLTAADFAARTAFYSAPIQELR